MSTKKENFEVRTLVFNMEKMLYRQKAISDLLGMLAFTADNGLAITDFKEGIFTMYKLALDNHEEMEQLWEKMMEQVTQND